MPIPFSAPGCAKSPRLYFARKEHLHPAPLLGCGACHVLLLAHAFSYSACQCRGGIGLSLLRRAPADRAFHLHGAGRGLHTSPISRDAMVYRPAYLATHRGPGRNFRHSRPRQFPTYSFRGLRLHDLLLYRCSSSGETNAMDNNLVALRHRWSAIARDGSGLLPAGFPCGSTYQLCYFLVPHSWSCTPKAFLDFWLVV